MKAYIVGFAPSWVETPWGQENAEFWGMNALHKVAGDKDWDRWFQLHDIGKHHKADFDEHVEWLRESELPVYMFEEHLAKYGELVPNAVRYPRAEVMASFGPLGEYFTNTVSWMLALAIMEQFEEIGVYGIDMAQDSEYGSQRPSCEAFIGVALGRGIGIDVPETSDLLKSPFLYGLEDGDFLEKKLRQRRKELVERQQQHAHLVRQNQSIVDQLAGAIENTDYILRAWTIPSGAE